MMEGEIDGSSSLAAGFTGQSTLAGAMDVDADLQELPMQSIEQNGMQNGIIQQPPVLKTSIEINGFDDDVKDEIDFNDDYTELLGSALKAKDGTTMITNDVVKARTGYVYSAHMMLHAHPAMDFSEENDQNVQEIHPEQPERISRIHAVLSENGCIQRMRKFPIRQASLEEVMKVHPRSMWDGVEVLQNFSNQSLVDISKKIERHSLYVNRHTSTAARLSCGGVIEMCDAVASRKVKNGFAIVRPPGHHAEPHTAMGFCFYNNVAVATRILQEKYGKATDDTRIERILILDWDVHHGNGTQSAFWDDPNVLYISIHRHENGNFYPSGPEGGHDRCGGEKAKGKNVNIPWSTAGMDDGDYIAAFLQIVMPIGIEFSPDFVIISAGFDAAAGDPLGCNFVTPAGYGHMTHMLSSLADGRLVVALEGGYDLDAIANSALHVTEVLLGESPQDLEPGTVCGETADRNLQLVRRTHSRYWKCMREADHEARENEDEGLARYALAQAVASHRAYEIQRKYVLTSWPITGTAFNGQVLCSPTILSDDKILLFVHDMGNLRMGLQDTMMVQAQADLMSIVDSSSQMIEWAKEVGLGLLDLCVISEHPTKQSALTSGNRQRQSLDPAQIHYSRQQENARELVLHVWDNIVTMLMHAKSSSPKKIMLMGMGGACDAILHLIHVRKADDVCGVIQIPGYGQLPATSSSAEQKRKWYFRNSQVYVPHDHSVYQNAENGVVTAKRFGKLIRSDENRAVQILKKEFGSITDYIQAKLLDDD